MEFLMKEIKHMEDIDEVEVNKEEKNLKTTWKNNQREANQMKEKAATLLKNEELRKRMERKYQK
jgi:hypothetical protein